MNKHMPDLKKSVPILKETTQNFIVNTTVNLFDNIIVSDLSEKAMNLFVFLVFGLLLGIAKPTQSSFQQYNYRKGMRPAEPVEYEEKYYCSAPSYALEFCEVELKEEDSPLCSATAPESILDPYLEPISLETKVTMCSGRPLLLQTSVTSVLSINLGVSTAPDLIYGYLLEDNVYEAYAAARVILTSLQAVCDDGTVLIDSDVEMLSRSHALSNELLAPELSSSALSHQSMALFPWSLQKSNQITGLFQEYKESPSLLHVFTSSSQTEVTCTFTWEFELVVEAAATCNGEPATEDKAFAEAEIESLSIVVTTSG